MAEIDWFAVVSQLDYLLEMVDEASTALCELKFFKGCLVVNEKVVPVLKSLVREAEAAKRMARLAEESPELGEEGEEEIPEMELSAEQRARLVEEEL